MPKNTPDARNRILQAAVRIFAEKGFDGSRIDEVAKEAGVPKSLIYYHFEGKDQILKVLMDDFLERYMALIRQSINDAGKADHQGLEGRVQGMFYEFGRSNEDLLRVMLIDSFKKENKTPFLFRVVEELVKAETAGRPEGSVESGEINRRLVVEFFTMLMPLYAFIAFSEPWVGYFGMDAGELGRLFMGFVIKPHAEYHAKYDGQ